MSVGVIIRKVRFIARTLCVILKPQYHVCANIPFHSTDCMHKTVLKVGKCFLSFQTFETSFLSTSLQNCQLSYQLYVRRHKQREKSPTARRKVRKLQLFQPQCMVSLYQQRLNNCTKAKLAVLANFFACFFLVFFPDNALFVWYNITDSLVSSQ